MSIIINSDAFQERLAARKAVLVDPKIQATVEDRLSSLARRSLDKLLERLDSGVPISNGDLVKMAQLGVGDRNQTKNAPQTQNNLYVVNIPPQAQSADKWLQNAQGVRGGPVIIENGGE